MFSIVIAS